MTKAEAFARANWWREKIGKSIYIMHRKDVDYEHDQGYFVLTEDDDVREHMRYAEIYEYINVRLNDINIDIWDNQRIGVGHA